MDAQGYFDQLRLRAAEFTVTGQHLKLLRRANVEWDDIEFGAPCIDGKRPYGNGDVIGDIAEILGRDLPGGDYPENVEEALTKLHAETGIALQIALTTGEFREGRYVRDPLWSDWHRE